MTTQPAVDAQGLVKRFGAVTALAGVDLRVPAGEVLALVGPNGAGKTTAVRILATLLPPDGGHARITGLDVVRQAPAVRRVIGLSGQYAAVDAYLTGRENLTMIGRLSGLRRSAARRRAGDLLELFGLGAAADRQSRTYSGGTRRRLDVAASLVARPAVLFLDEPTTGLDPRGRLDLWRLIGELAAQGTTVLFSTQYLTEADRYADRVVLLDRGLVLAAGTPAQLKAAVGGDRLELRPRPGDDARPLAAAMAGLGPAPPSVDPGAGLVVVPVADGPDVLPEVAARLAAAGLRIAGLTLRRPSLDDVFLDLTGAPVAPYPADAGSAS
ncbi:daunorubicin resistance protein DrrA family ABC transporter ATP-binding protein [Amorphoplanes nipponensis]|uniref:Daunorubicin resistance protein DrrA family ABC transporter ATP-binding protein n=1 Tax=Actinoplanes nipponensis TaxID=135950 RepID=A0A919MQX8_9ACTN|nr:daunorubicin resistance protein DrrA family ABC transporter ATP-binding protein [Actinoplanes nipponensis]